MKEKERERRIKSILIQQAAELSEFRLNRQQKLFKFNKVS